jgi:hypothetical protein
MRIGDIVLTPRGRGRIVKGALYRKPRAPGCHWVFLFYPSDITNRVIAFRPSELRIVKG